MRLNPKQIRAIGDWQEGQQYLPDMEVISGNARYRCISEHISTDNFANDHVNWQGENSEIAAITKEPTGFIDRSTTQIEFLAIERKFTISPVNNSFSYWIQSFKFIKNAPVEIVITNIEGGHFLYFDGSSLIDDPSPPPTNLLYGVCFIAYVYWSVSDQVDIIFADERHGLTMDWATHALAHNTYGTQYYSGLGLSNITVDQSGELDTHSQFGIEQGMIADEDLTHALAELLPYAQIPVLYQEGANGDWHIKSADNFPIIYNGTAGYSGTRVAYNPFQDGIHQLLEVPNKQYVLAHIYATNEVNRSFLAIAGKDIYAKPGAAKRAAPIEALNITGLPLVEFYLIGTIIIQTESAYTNTPKARIVSTDLGADYVDFRQASARYMAGISAISSGSWQLLTSQPTVDWDVGRDDTGEITLTGNITLNNPLHLTSGAKYNLVINQDSVGGWNIVWGDAYKFSGGIPPTLSAAIDAIDVLEFLSNGSSMYCTTINLALA